jgi:hypothetical protein
MIDSAHAAKDYTVAALLEQQAANAAWLRANHEHAVHCVLQRNLKSKFLNEWDMRQLRWALEPLVEARAPELVIEHDKVNKSVNIFKRGCARNEALYVLHECDAVQPPSISSSSDDLSQLSCSSASCVGSSDPE